MIGDASAILPAASNLVDRVVRRDKRARNARRARAAVGLDHVAVDVHACARPACSVEHGTQRAADQALDLLRAAALLAARGFAVVTGVGGARQHAVFGRDPALIASAQELGHALEMLAVQITLVSPNSTSTDPSACFV